MCDGKGHLQKCAISSCKNFMISYNLVIYIMYSWLTRVAYDGVHVFVCGAHSNNSLIYL